MYTANVLEVLLSLSLLVHGVQDGLALGLVALPQLVNLPLHLLVQRGHALVKLLVGQVLQLPGKGRLGRTLLWWYVVTCKAGGGGQGDGEQGGIGRGGDS